MEGKRETWIGALEFAPKVAAQLGLYVAQFSTFEIMMPTFYSYVSGIPLPQTQIAFGCIINIPARLDIISESLKISARSDAKKNVLEGFCLRGRKINSSRNELIHGTYRVYRDTGQVWLTTWMHTLGRPSQAEWITEDSLKENIHTIRAYMGDWMSLHGFSGLPADLPSI